MKSRKNGQPQPRLQKLYRPTPAQLSAAHKVALACRDGWRKEVAAKVGDGDDTPERAVQPRRVKDEPARRAAFARAIARAELGRHYWDERKLKRLRTSGPQRPLNGKE